MQKYGTKEAKHQLVIPKYNSWGLSGSTQIDRIPSTELDNTYINLLHLIDNLIDLSTYKIVMANKIAYFQGKNLPQATAIMIRLINNEQSNSHLDGEHISLIYAQENKQLLGYTRMQTHSKHLLLDHQTVLNTAFELLKKVAPDLINAKTHIPPLNKLVSDERMIFDPALTVDNVELQWIDEHTETINSNQQIITVYGQKVKMYLPKTDLWAWIIVDKCGRIITFERNISWDFIKMERQTQMWLHDKWLIAQKINCIN